MQQPIRRRDVYEPSLTATIGGRAVEVASASLEREMPDPLTRPSLTAASGEVVALEGGDLVSTVATPWDPGTQWPPVPETAASVQMDTGSGFVQILGGGRVTGASGGTPGRAVEVGVADAYQTLDRPISWDALAAAMPSLSEQPPARYVSLYSTAITDRILRYCGWYSTPPLLGYSVLSVPAQGTLWPERGTCLTSIRRTGGAYPGWQGAPWGWSVTDVTATYYPGGSYTLKSAGHIEMVALAGAANGQTMFLDATNDGGLIRLSWTDTTASVRMTGTDGAVETVVSLSRDVGSLLYVTIRYVSATKVEVTLRVDGTSSTSSYTVPSALTSTALSEAAINGEGVGGGFQIAFPPVPGRLAGWTPNAQIQMRATLRNSLTVVPSVAGENCADLLAAQCEAECATYWIDETGVLQWWDMARLEAQNSVATLTSDDDITDDGFTWSHDLSSVKSKVNVKWREPLRAWSSTYSVDLWQGRGSTIQPGDDQQEEWINTPGDEVWIMPDLLFGRVGTTGNDPGNEFNAARGSWYGATIASSDEWAQSHGTLGMSMERVTDAAFKYAVSWKGTDQVTMSTVSKDANSYLYLARRNFDLPILRGKAKFSFGDQTMIAGQTGLSTAPEMEIDAGWWIQSAEQAKYTADYAAARVTVPQPVLSSVALIPVPGLQLGDMVTVTDTLVTRLTVQGVVIADSRSINADMDMSHAVSIRPVYVTRNGVTWAEWGQVMAQRSWRTWGGQQAGNTWQQWATTPLLGEDIVNG